jgi:hypothetical protein
MASLNTMVKRIAGLAGTNHVTEWESQFIESVLARTKQGDDTRPLTEKQIDVIERIFSKHFGD